MAYSIFLIFSDEGGEDRTIEFMEREGRASSKTPLLDHGSERGIIQHHFPFNLFMKPWKLSQWVYQVIKFGIVQYVSLLLRIGSLMFVVIKIMMFLS